MARQEANMRAGTRASSVCSTRPSTCDDPRRCTYMGGRDRRRGPRVPEFMALPAYTLLTRLDVPQPVPWFLGSLGVLSTDSTHTTARPRLQSRRCAPKVHQPQTSRVGVSWRDAGCEQHRGPFLGGPRAPFVSPDSIDSAERILH